MQPTSEAALIRFALKPLALGVGVSCAVSDSPYKASDKPSDNILRQWQTEHDVLRHPNSSDLQKTRPNPTASDGTAMHGKEKVYGSIP